MLMAMHSAHSIHGLSSLALATRKVGQFIRWVIQSKNCAHALILAC